MEDVIKTVDNVGGDYSEGIKCILFILYISHAVKNRLLILLDISVIREGRALIYSGSIDLGMPNMICYELKATVAQKSRKM